MSPRREEPMKIESILEEPELIKIEKQVQEKPVREEPTN